MLEYILVAVFVMFVALTIVAFYTDDEFKYVPFEDKFLLIALSMGVGAVWPVTLAAVIFTGLGYLMFMASAYVAKYIKGQLRNEG
jgi:predicted membrane protein